MAKVLLLVGLPASGKTTRARALAREHHALRLTPDEWMIPLFGESEGNGKRDVLEGRLLSLAVQAVRVGTNVVLDFGCWSRDERAAIRWLFETQSAEFELVYLPIDPVEQLDRIDARWAARPQQTFPITPTDLDNWRAIFAEPDAEELAGRWRPSPPASWSTWLRWAQDRWPSLSTD